jgi:hypothetical protein
MLTEELSAVMALGTLTSQIFLYLVPRNQLVHPFQRDLAALLVLALGFGESYLAHSGGNPMRLAMTLLSLILERYSEVP